MSNKLVVAIAAACVLFGTCIGAGLALPIGIIVGHRSQSMTTSKQDGPASRQEQRQASPPVRHYQTRTTPTKKDDSVPGVPNVPFGPHTRIIGPDGLPVRR